MKKLWNSKIFWFLVILVDVYFTLGALTIRLFTESADLTASLWPPYLLPFAFIIALFPFIVIRFFPASRLTKIIIQTKKVFKIIFMSMVPFIILTYSAWYLPDIAFSNTASFKVACSYIKQDTTIINKIGTLTDLKEIHTEYLLSSKEKNADHEILVIGQTGKAIAEIKMTLKESWTVDKVEYKIK